MMKIRQYLVPVLLLTTIIISSSNAEIPFSYPNPESPDYDGQHDNISNLEKLKTIIYNLPVKSSKNEDSSRSNPILVKYLENDPDKIVDNDETYNGEGFRTEQWHNYPRQMDRLQRFIFKSHKDKINNDGFPPDKNTGLDLKDTADLIAEDILTNEYLVDSNDGMHNIYDAVIATTNPLLVLKIRLASLDDLGNFKSDPTSYSNEIEENDDRLQNVIKIKRGDNNDESEFADEPIGERKEKRIFSLWSRLQSLSHKGHDIHHRRHFHAFYGLPDDGNVLTAETRALMRPPGSPLRWG